MTFRALLVTYILGGLTFIPLVLAALLVPAWLALPKVATGAGQDGATEDEGDKSGEEAKKKLAKINARKRDSVSTEAAAEATFAVLRSFDFQAANAALNARNTSGNTAGGVTGTTDGEGDGNDAPSASVYQSVYRSVFAPARSNTPLSSSREVLENDEPTPGADGSAKKKATPANVFYIVLRHGHLMLYDSASQLEVRHVISLALHTVSLSEGPSLNGEETPMKDGDLFIKRTAIVLTPVELPNGHLQSQTSSTKPFYLFSTLCSDKEDFYHALLYTRANPPIPEPIDPDDAIKLQSTLHSTSLTPETRALNALLGRVFLGIYHTDWLKDLIQRKIENKISRVQKPSFLEKLTVQSIDLGDAAPILSNPRLKDLNISGEMIMAFDLRYSGGVNITISAEARLDLGPRFKTRTVDLVLATTLHRLSGHMLVRIKPPPSNRIWFCFETPPEMDVKVEPVVSQRKISYTFILRTIEDRIRAVVTETLVKPNWDDVPFFSTMGQQVRGGIWHDEGSERDPNAAEKLAAKDEKSRSMPALPLGADQDSSAGSSGSEKTSKMATGSSTAKDLATELKRRSVASLPARSATNQSTSSAFSTTPEPGNSPSLPPQRPLRSPSFTSPSASQPSVALDESLANVDPNRAVDSNAQSKRWRLRQAAPPLPARKEAVEAMREMRDRVLAHREAAEASATQADVLEGVGSYVEEPTEGYNTGDELPEGYDSRRTSDSPAAFVKTHKRTDTNVSTASAASGGSQSQKKTILAATAAATTAARNWSWNALANARTKGSPTAQQGPFSSTGQTQQQPMGRGQPLPPPGTPLPGPQKGLFGALGSVRRKPVPKLTPTLPGRSDDTGRSSRQNSEAEVANAATSDPQSTVTDEYGPWRENSGMEDENAVGEKPSGNITTFASAVQAATSQQRQTTTPKVPPPLPKRKDTQATSETAGSDTLNASNERSTHPPRAPMTSESSFMDPKVSSDKLIDPSKAPIAQSPAQAETKFMLGADVREEDFEHDRSAYETTIPTPAPREEEKHGDGDVIDDGSSEEIIAVPAPLEEDEEEEDDWSFSKGNAQSGGPQTLDHELNGKEDAGLDDSQDTLHP